jgi:hypoxanthine phosphoribosyltransferase
MGLLALHGITVVRGAANSKRTKVESSFYLRPARAVANGLTLQIVPRSTHRNPPPSSRKVPAAWRKEVDRVLIREEEIGKRVRTLAFQIARDYRGKDLVLVALLNGTVMFLADLIRHLQIPLRLDFIGVSSYGTGTESGELVFTKELRLDVKGRDVLLVDDILDTGKTLKRVSSTVRSLKPRSVKICVFLNKAARRIENVTPDYFGFDIPDEFVVGYGLDFAERYRNLPFVGVLKEAIYQK